MPMNPRLLRPTSSTLDADAAVYLNAVAQADGQQLEPAVRQAINDFVTGCKADGIWDAIKASCILAGARTLAGALVPLKGPAPGNNNFTASDYNRETGLVGDGSTTYLDSGRTTLDDDKNDCHLSVWETTLHSDGTNFGASVGANDASGSGSISQIVYRASDGNRLTRLRDFDARVNTGVTATGFYGVSRSSSATKTVRYAGSSSNVSEVSVEPPSLNFHVLAQNLAGTGAVNCSNARLAFYSIGESVDLAALDARVTALITAIGNAI